MVIRLIVSRFVEIAAEKKLEMKKKILLTSIVGCLSGKMGDVAMAVNRLIDAETKIALMNAK